MSCLRDPSVAAVGGRDAQTVWLMGSVQRAHVPASNVEGRRTSGGTPAANGALLVTRFWPSSLSAVSVRTDCRR